MAFVDFHCHLDLYPDHAAAVAQCERDGIYTLAVTTTPRAWPRNRDLAIGSRYVRAALGLHPQLVGERHNEIALFEKYLEEARYIGEVGLDSGRDHYRSLDLQRKVFERILRACAEQGGKILTVHSARSATPVLDMIETHLPRSRAVVVLHWFSGSKREAQRAVDLGCFFSVNTEMLRNERHHTMVASLPEDRLLTETDGPFTRTGSRPTEPSDVQAAVMALARIRGLDVDRTVVLVQSNLRKLLSFDSGAYGNPWASILS
jgi:TatD DNase family protein